MVGDYHTHTKYSKFFHGKHTIEQMANAANSIGLKELAITDHGPKHMFFGINKHAMQHARSTVNAMNDRNKVKVYLGLEANLISKDGDIDMRPADAPYVDFVAVGFHRGTWSKFANIFNVNLCKCKQKDPKQIEINTQAYIRAMQKYSIAFLTHLQEYIRVDVKRVAEVAAACGTYIELNNRHFKFTEQEVKDMLSTNVQFIINSDAHKASAVGEVSRVLKLIDEYGIPKERIVNWDGKQVYLKPYMQIQK